MPGFKKYIGNGELSPAAFGALYGPFSTVFMAEYSCEPGCGKGISFVMNKP